MAWQLIQLSDGKALTEPAPLPENWGPMFGLKGFQDRLGNLLWLGVQYADMGWVEVPDIEQIADPTTADEAKKQAIALLAESDWAMLADVPMTVGEKEDWIEYRRKLREIEKQPGFPERTQFPTSPRQS